MAGDDANLQLSHYIIPANKMAGQLSRYIIPANKMASDYANLRLSRYIIPANKMAGRLSRYISPANKMDADLVIIKNHSPKTGCGVTSPANKMAGNVANLQLSRYISPMDADLVRRSVLMSSCNGLVAVVHAQDIVLWSTLRGTCMVVPPSKLNFGEAEKVSVGFGCHVCGYEFRVVRIFSFKKTKEMKAEMYSSTRNSWFRIRVPVAVGYFTVCSQNQDVIVDWNPYWIACTDDDCHVLVGFDVSDIEFKIVPWPPIIIEDPNRKMKFVDWERKLGAVVCGKGEEDGNNALQWIDVWTYDERKKKWGMEKRFEVMADKLLLNCVACSKSGNILGECGDGNMFVFAPKKGKGKKGRLTTSAHMSRNHWDAFAHHESLAFVMGMRSGVVTEDGRFAGGIIAYDGFLVYRLNPRDYSGEFITCSNLVPSCVRAFG